MPPHPLPSDREPTPNHADDDAQYYRAVLHDLIDMGADLARLVHRQAKAQAEARTPDNPAPEPQADPTIPFDRIARSIRRAIILARTLAAPPAQAPVTTPAQHRLAARKRVLRDVEDAIQRTTSGPKAAALHAEFLNRLDSPDFDHDIHLRPVAEIVADICRDLGIAAPPGVKTWKRRTPADIAALCARAAAAQTAPPRPAPLPTRAPPDLTILDHPARFRGT